MYVQNNKTNITDYLTKKAWLHYTEMFVQRFENKKNIRPIRIPVFTGLPMT